jgi:hypothetical protein
MYFGYEEKEYANFSAALQNCIFSPPMHFGTALYDRWTPPCSPSPTRFGLPKYITRLEMVADLHIMHSKVVVQMVVRNELFSLELA